MGDLFHHKKKIELRLDNMALILVSAMFKRACVGYSRDYESTQTADMKCPGFPNINHDIVCYITICAILLIYNLELRN